MQAQQLETTDIFKSAVFLCHGGRLADVRLKQRQRGIVSFLIEGDGILELDLGYRNGTAQVNALQFRQTLNHLRDVLFTRLRENNHPAPRLRQAGGRYENDSKRGDRIDQARR